MGDVVVVDVGYVGLFSYEGCYFVVVIIVVVVVV